MSLYAYKLYGSLAIWLITLGAGIKPFRTRSVTDSASPAIAEAFASGIFLGASLFHMLPDAVMEFKEIYPTSTYPIANLLCVFGFVVLLFLEKVVFRFIELSHAFRMSVLSLALAGILSIHAAIEGLAFGINTTIATISIIFIAIIAHKGSESFALATMLQKTHFNRKKNLSIFLIFSMITPMMIGVGSWLASLFRSEVSILLQAIFNALAAGSFLYIATLHLTVKHYDHQTNRVAHFLSLLFGLLIMGIVALWV
ncbi:MAG: ZIP family metal transporter [Gammaproteobacteria bacterium]